MDQLPCKSPGPHLSQSVTPKANNSSLSRNHHQTRLGIGNKQQKGVSNKFSPQMEKHQNIRSQEPFNNLTKNSFSTNLNSQHHHNLGKQFHNQKYSQNGLSAVESNYHYHYQKQRRRLGEELHKKNELIKYLQRKCGQQILKSTSKLMQQISTLQAQNIELSNKMEQACAQRCTHIHKTNKDTNRHGSYQFNSQICHSQKAQGGRLKYSLFLHQGMTEFNGNQVEPEQLRQIILAQAQEIETLLGRLRLRQIKIISYHHNNKDLRRALMQKFQEIHNNITGNANEQIESERSDIRIEELLSQSFEVSQNIVSGQNMGSNLESNSQLQYDFEIDKLLGHIRKLESQLNLLKNQYAQQRNKKHKQKGQQTTNCCKHIGVQTMTQLSQVQTGVGTEDGYDHQITGLRQENSRLLVEQEILRGQINELKEELVFINQKIAACYQEDQQSPPLKAQFLPDYNPGKLSGSCVFDYYVQILSIFGIHATGEFPTILPGHHELLVDEIMGLRMQMNAMLKQFSKIQKQMVQIFDENQLLEHKLEQQKQANTVLTSEVRRAYTLLDCMNEKMMGCSAKLLEYQLRGILTIMHERIAEDEELD